MGKFWVAEGREDSLLPCQPPILQVLEVLTAAVEYGLEELREVGSWVAISFPLPLMGTVHTLPHTPANLERNVHQYRKKYGYLYIKTGIDACLYAKGYVCAL